MDYNLWQQLINSNIGQRATLPIQYLFGDRDKAEQFWNEDMGRFGDLLLSTTKPFRTGANILAQNWGSALTGKDMGQSENQGGFLKWLAGGITPEEQQVISNKPYLSALKSGAGMAATLAPFGTKGLRTAQLASKPLTNRVLQLTSQGALEGGLGGFGLSREGEEVQDTLVGAGMGAGGELLMDYLTNPQFRKMITEASTYVDPNTGGRMYRGALGDDDIVFDGSLPKTKELPHDLSDLELTEISDYNNPDTKEFFNVDLEDTKYPPVDLADDIEITNYQDYDNPLAKLESEAKKYKTPEEFVKAKEMIPVYRGQDHPDFTAFDGRTKDRFLPGMKGTSFATSRSAASNYGDYIVEGYVDKGSLLKRQDIDKEVLNSIDKKIKSFDLGDYGEGYEFEKVVSKIADIAKEKGKGAINLGDFFDRSLIDDEIRVISKDSFFDKNQLQDIWKRAHPNELGNSIRGGFREIIKKMGRDGLK